MSRGYIKRSLTKKDVLFTSFSCRKNRPKHAAWEDSSSHTTWLVNAEWSNLFSPNRVSMALDWRHADTDPKRRNISQSAASLCMCIVLNTGIEKPQTVLTQQIFVLLSFNQTCPWKSLWSMGLIEGKSRAHFEATLINMHLAVVLSTLF